MAASNPRIAFRLGPDAPRLEPLEGAHLLVLPILNVEHWPFGSPMPRTLLTPPHGAANGPDVANFTWVEYGLRCGVPRMVAVAAELGVPLTAALNASVATHYRPVLDLLLAHGCDIVAHGVVQRSLQLSDDPAATIAESLDLLEAATGTRPLGWLGPGMSQTADTPELLVAAGVRFNHDWMLDDRPVRLATANGPLVGLPYTLECNDVPVYAIGHQPDGQLAARVAATLDALAPEAVRNPLIVPIGLHPHLMGVGHRIAEWRAILTDALARPGVRIVTSTELYRWYVDQRPGDGPLP